MGDGGGCAPPYAGVKAGAARDKPQDHQGSDQLSQSECRWVCVPAIVVVGRQEPLRRLGFRCGFGLRGRPAVDALPAAGRAAPSVVGGPAVRRAQGCEKRTGGHADDQGGQAHDF